MCLPHKPGDLSPILSGGGKAKAEGEGDSDATSKGKLGENQAFLFLGQSYSPHESQLHLWGLVR